MKQININKFLNKFYILFLLVLLLVLLFCIIFKFNKIQFKEALTEKKTIILIGDSILNNSKYVSIGNSVADNLKLKHDINKVVLLARDGATIETCFNQFQSIANTNININNNDCNLYISIGGNNILNMLNKNINVDEKQINQIFKKYKELIEKIKKQYPNANIYIFNLYFTLNKTHNPIVEEWNKLLNSFCLKNKYILLRLDNLITTNDLIFEVEPSASGAKKIAELILNT